MKKYLQNVLSEPTELAASLGYSMGAGRPALEQAARLVRNARHVVITGIGSSWHAGMAVQALFASHGRFVHLEDASELLHFRPLEPETALIVLSRSGKSVEIVKLLDKAAAAKASVIAVTNTPDSPLAKRAQAVLELHAAFDHVVSVTMYSALGLVGGLLAANAAGALNSSLQSGLESALRQANGKLATWQKQLAESDWFDPTLPAYFLARGSSLASAYEMRLLWEEAAKSPASVLGTGSFRHGPQEMIVHGARIALFVDPKILAREDLDLVADLRSRGVKVMLIGQNVPVGAADLILDVPHMTDACACWQFLLDIMPAQLAAHRLSEIRNVDCDAFVICPYIISAEGGLNSR